MLVDATLLIQDIQLLCFAIIFGVLALQRWNDTTRRWLWFGFLANAVGAACDLLAGRLPNWISHGLNLEMIPLSYALLNVAVVRFEGLGRRAVWISGVILLGTLPFYLAWCNDPSQFRGFALGDLAIALECVVTVAILCGGDERSTRAPRLLLGGFLAAFAGIEFTRAGVAFLLHADPDVYSPKLEITSAVAYIVNTSVLPLTFIWMMNARLEANLIQQSIVDSLTGVLNRRGLEEALERELARFRRYGDSLTVAMIDLDHFKKLNDTYGHAAGDTVLTGIAALLRRLLRETDVIGRFGGEEFVLLLPHADAGESRPILEELCRAVEDRSDWLAHAAVRATASFGVTSTYGRRSVTAGELLHEADVALYQAKENGRNQVTFFAADERPATLRHSDSSQAAAHSQS
jgi:diguanylate cyclase (GGDEF)-like protein